MIAYLLTALEALVGALETNSTTQALELQVLPETERHRILEDFNATVQHLDQEALVHELFERRARNSRRPSRSSSKGSR